MIHTLKKDSYTSLRVIHLTTEVTSVLTLIHKYVRNYKIKQKHLPETFINDRWFLEKRKKMLSHPSSFLPKIFVIVNMICIWIFIYHSNH